MPPAAELLTAYRAGTERHDEMVTGASVLRDHWSTLAAHYETLGHHELLRRRAEVQRLLEQDGVTYNIAAGDHRPNRPWRLDPIPLIVPSDEWRHIEQGSIQRAELLNLMLGDLYGERRLLRSGLIPPEMVFADPQFLRACDGITIPGEKQLVVVATDLARVTDGRWMAIGQRTQAPSGASYALENRRALSRVFPQMFRDTGVQRLTPYVAALRTALIQAAPAGVDEPTIVVLSPGALSETAFEHASIAAQLGFPLVQGADFQLRDGAVGLRTVGGWIPVHVILRRVDAAFSDPLALRSDSTLGIPGLVDACRRGVVSVVNTLGSGVLENAGIAALMQTLSTELLGTDLILDSVPTWWCGDDVGRSHVLANLGELVIRPLSRMSLQHSADTRRLSASAIDDLRRRIVAEPGQWVGQEHLEVGTAPVLTTSGMRPRRTVVRSFAIAHGDGYLAMPGGLARTASGTGDAPITNRTGAHSKDIWVLRDGAENIDEPWTSDSVGLQPTAIDTLSARAAEHLFWLGRYAERAEATVRLVRTVNTRRNEFEHSPAGPGPAALVVLLEAVTRMTGTFPGFVGDDAETLFADPSDELVSLIVDDQRSGTIAHAVRHMFDAIDVLRDQLSVDTWLVVGSMQRELERLGSDSADDSGSADDTDSDGAEAVDADAAGSAGRVDAADASDDATDDVGLDREAVMASVLDSLLHGLLSLAGLANESMVRDQAWQFMDAGRRIERALQMTMLVASTLVTERSAVVESLLLESVLSTGESVITSRRRYRSRAVAASTIELLCGDRGNPRSVRFQVDRLAECLASLSGDRPHAFAPAMAHFDTVAALVEGTDWLALAAPDDAGHRAGLTEFVVAMRAALMALSNAITTESFTRIQPQLAVATTPSSATSTSGISS